MIRPTTQPESYELTWWAVVECVKGGFGGIADE